MTSNVRRPILSAVVSTLSPAVFPIVSGMFATATAVLLISALMGAPITVPLVSSVLVAGAFAIMSGKIAVALRQPHACGRKVARPEPHRPCALAARSGG